MPPLTDGSKKFLSLSLSIFVCVCEMEELRKLNVNKSLGPDGIHLRFPKNTVAELL